MVGLLTSSSARSPDDIDAAAIHNMLGIVGKFSGTFDVAAKHYARAIAVYRAAGAPDNTLAALHHNLGGSAAQPRRPEDRRA